MNRLKLTGPGSGAEKYDLLTAMAVEGLASGGSLQTSMMRLIALITARYNWATNEVSIGHRELAALWAVDERTAKRETKRLIDGGLLKLKRPGVRGRVACYQLNTEHIYQATQARWTNVGSDFKARMSGRANPEQSPPEPTTVVRVDFASKARTTLQEDSHGPWSKVRESLARLHPKLFAAWLEPLVLEQIGEGVVTLVAPTRFSAQYIMTHLLSQIEAACTSALGTPMRCVVVEKSRV